MEPPERDLIGCQSRKKIKSGRKNEVRWRRFPTAIATLALSSGSILLAEPVATASGSVSIEERVDVILVNNSPLLAMVLASIGGAGEPIATFAPATGFTTVPATGANDGPTIPSGNAGDGLTPNSEAISVDVGTAPASTTSGPTVPQLLVQYN